jgi:hypothetical protein
MERQWKTKESKKEFRRCIRVELAKQRDEEKELIMKTKTKDILLHYLRCF